MIQLKNTSKYNSGGLVIPFVFLIEYSYKASLSSLEKFAQNSPHDSGAFLLSIQPKKINKSKMKSITIFDESRLSVPRVLMVGTYATNKENVATILQAFPEFFHQYI